MVSVSELPSRVFCLALWTSSAYPMFVCLGVRAVTVSIGFAGQESQAVESFLAAPGFQRTVDCAVPAALLP